MINAFCVNNDGNTAWDQNFWNYKYDRETRMVLVNPLEIPRIKDSKLLNFQNTAEIEYPSWSILYNYLGIGMRVKFQY